MGVTVASIVLSMLVGRYQIAVGKRGGRASVVADGEETLSDGRVEMAVCAGVIGEYLFHAPWLEHLFGLAVTALLLRTGTEIFKRGWQGLLHRSIGAEHEEAIVAIAKKTHGVFDVRQIKTFMEGNKVIVILKALTRAGGETQTDIKYAIAVLIASYLRQKEFVDGDFFIRFDVPDPNRHRRAYAVMTQAGTVVMAATLGRATHLLVCDMENDRAARETLEENPTTIEKVTAFLEQKRVKRVFVWNVDETEKTALAERNIGLEETPSYQLDILGV